MMNQIELMTEKHPLSHSLEVEDKTSVMDFDFFYKPLNVTNESFGKSFNDEGIYNNCLVRKDEKITNLDASSSSGSDDNINISTSPLSLSPKLLAPMHSNHSEFMKKPIKRENIDTGINVVVKSKNHERNLEVGFSQKSDNNRDIFLRNYENNNSTSNFTNVDQISDFDLSLCENFISYNEKIESIENETIQNIIYNDSPQSSTCKNTMMDFDSMDIQLSSSDLPEIKENYFIGSYLYSIIPFQFYLLIVILLIN